MAQLPIEITHLGSACWLYILRSAGAILLVNVPATIIRSAWRGVGLNTTPYLSKSYRLVVACIISTAQQASPNVNGQSDPFRTQLTTFGTYSVAKFSGIYSISSYLSSIVVHRRWTFSLSYGTVVRNRIYRVYTLNRRPVNLWGLGP